MTYKTKDFPIAATLRALGVPIHTVEKQGRVSYFIFDVENIDIENLINKYWNRELKVEARALIEAIKELKNRIYN